jgi:histidinol-phosphate aminotransferase
MYEISAKILGRDVIGIELQEENFDIDLNASATALESKECALAFFSYPNNPTANLFSRKKIDYLRDTYGVFTVIDEAYYHYSKDSYKEEALSRQDTVVLRTLSKIGLASLRIGVMIAKEEVVREINKLRLPFNITYPSQVIARFLLTKGRDFIEWAVAQILRERERLYRELSGIEGIEVFPSEANFLLIRARVDAELLHSKLVEEGVLIRRVDHLPKLKNCLRVSVGKEEENTIFLEKLSYVMKELL